MVNVYNRTHLKEEKGHSLVDAMRSDRLKVHERKIPDSKTFLGISIDIEDPVTTTEYWIEDLVKKEETGIIVGHE